MFFITHFVEMVWKANVRLSNYCYSFLSFVQIRQMVDEQLQASPLLLSPISPGPSDQASGGRRDLDELVERRVAELGQWMTGEVREKCAQLMQQHCSSEHVLPVLSILLPPDLPAKVGTGDCMYVWIIITCNQNDQTNK